MTVLCHRATKATGLSLKYDIAVLPAVRQPRTEVCRTPSTRDRSGCGLAGPKVGGNRLKVFAN